MPLTSLRILFLPLLIALLSASVNAEGPSDDDPNSRDAFQHEIEAATQGMQEARQNGPLDIPVLNQAVLHLPHGYAYVPNPAASRFMKAMGNRLDEGFLGLIFPSENQADWVASLSFEKSGYIRDDDAKNWNIENMFKSIQEGAIETNKIRASRGIPELDVLGWAEAPDYDAVSHRLVWALTVNNRGAAETEPSSVNYNTYTLGREGFVSMNLVTSSNQLEQRKPIARSLLASLEFNQGKRYEDFNAESDHIAEYGLTALVGGALVAKKFGLFALASVFLAKFGKIIAIAAAALFGIFGKRKGKKGEGSMDA